jgi:hypothetical protein
MKTVYSVFMFNGLNWVKETNGNEYFTKGSELQEELIHLTKLWSHLKSPLGIGSLVVEDDYVLAQHKELPTLPERTSWGTLKNHY